MLLAVALSVGIVVLALAALTVFAVAIIWEAFYDARNR
jgi:hypothetical protein